MDEEQLKQQLIHPYYAINFDPDFAAEHIPIWSGTRFVACRGL
jgi:hypothetical protein